jgi:prophage regulatory protein
VTRPLDNQQIRLILDRAPPNSFVRVKVLLPFIPISRMTLSEMVMRGTFPKPVRLSAQLSAWRVSEVRKWMTDNELI